MNCRMKEQKTFVNDQTAVVRFCILAKGKIKKTNMQISDNMPKEAKTAPIKTKQEAEMMLKLLEYSPRSVAL